MSGGRKRKTNLASRIVTKVARRKKRLSELKAGLALQRERTVSQRRHHLGEAGLCAVRGKDAPFGFQWTLPGKTGRLVAEPMEQQILKALFILLDNGRGYSAVAGHLNKIGEGKLSFRGRDWTSDDVRLVDRQRQMGTLRARS